MAVIDIEPFVMLVQKNDLLYNKNRTDYKDHDKKMQCWSTIAQAYNVPVSVILAKWKSLREKYIKERKQVRIHGPSALKWEHHHLFKFLDPFILPRNRPKRRHLEMITVTPSSVLEDSSSQGLGPEEQEQEPDPRSGGEGLSGNSPTVEDYNLHCSTSIHPASSSSLHMDMYSDHVASTSRDRDRGQKRPPSSEEIYASGHSDFTYMLHAKAERIKNTCQALTEDELFGCEVIEELRRKRSQKVKREIKMKILGIFNEFDGIGEE